MTREEALKHINDSTAESKNKLDDTVRALRMEIDNSPSPRYVMLSEKAFETVMFDVIRYRWAEQYPDAFLTCHVTGEEYERLPKAMYTYYIKTINGSLKEFMKLNELEDYHIHRLGYTDENRMDMFKKRLRFIEELLNDDIDIAKWCLNNVCI
jgi:hypothetical protein